MKISIFLRNLDEILSKKGRKKKKKKKKNVGISRISSENVNICGELQKILKKLRKFGQNPETDEIIQLLK